MGTWGADSFQNDWALDWLTSLRESGSALQVRATLNHVVEHGGTKSSSPSILERLRGRRRHTDWLTANAASKALAAAEIVAAWLGHPSTELPESILPWLQRHSSSFEMDLGDLARQTVNIVKNNSELKDLWEEGDPTKWRASVEDLERRLNLSSATDV